MTKQEMTDLLRCMGTDENTVTAMENAFDMGVEFERARIIEANKPEIERCNAHIKMLEDKLSGKA